MERHAGLSGDLVAAERRPRALLELISATAAAFTRWMPDVVMVTKNDDPSRFSEVGQALALALERHPHPAGEPRAVDAERPRRLLAPRLRAAREHVALRTWRPGVSARQARAIEQVHAPVVADCDRQ